MEKWQYAARMMQATAPAHVAAMAYDRFDAFVNEVIAEAGESVLRDIVRHMEQHGALARGGQGMRLV